jgi:hypothetical protein
MDKEVKMKRMHFLLAVGIILVQAGILNAAVPINPATGWGPGYFSWEGGLGQIDHIGYPVLDETEWEITVAVASIIGVTAYDDCVPGDEFDLYVDGFFKEWELEYEDIGGYYHGEHNSLLLTSGTHTITFYVSALAPCYTAGSANAYFTAATPCEVPVPGAIVLAVIGSAGVGYINRRKAQ